MKKFGKLFLTAATVLSLAACSGTSTASSTSGTGVSGTFEGTAQGNGGDVVVEITLENSVITAVTATGEKETDGIGTKAIEALPAAMVEGNTIAVDSISGATITSNAIIEAAEEAIESAGLNVADYQKEAEAEAKAEDVTKEADIVIVGAGGAGMTAAIVAADAGKSVIIVESQDVAGGNSVRSTGGMNACETPAEQENEFDEAAGVEKTLASAKENYADNAAIAELVTVVEQQWADYQANPEGYFDSAELMELDTLVGGKGSNDPVLVETLAENSASAIEWLASIGAELTSVGQFGGASVKRIHRPLNAEGKTTAVGAYVVPILEKNLAERNIEVLYNTTATKIIMSEGQAAGIVAEGKTGNTVTVNAKAVVLATGGFGANLDMVAELKPELEGFCTTNAAGAQGQGITMGQEVGAATVDLEQIQIHPTVHLDDAGNASLITEGLRGDGAILVNKEGKRFCDEVGTRDAVSAAEIAQTDSMAYLIVDQEMVDASSVIAGYINKGFTLTGETIEDLAAEMGVDGATLSETLDAWNACVEAGSDEEFGRTSFVKQLNVGPYYAISVTPGVHHTMGGLKINEKAEVLTADGSAIAGLFAAGEVTGGVHGANRLGGNAVADFTIFGRIAGESAAAFVK